MIAQTRIRIMIRRVLILLLVAVPLHAQQRDPARYEKVLLPILSPAPIVGADGSRWQTELWLRNASDAPLDVFPAGQDCISSVSCFETMRTYPSLAPHQTSYHVSAGTVEPWHVGYTFPYLGRPGRFLYVERSRIDDLDINLHLSDTSRRPVARGTQLPVVRASSFLDRTVNILGVPLGPGSRATLRIYSEESEANGRMAIRVLENTDHWEGLQLIRAKTLVDEVAQFDYDAASDNCGFAFQCPDGVRYQPGYIEITDLSQRWPQLNAAATVKFGLRIEIEPLTQGLKFWPMVSVTNDNTHEVTIYTAR